ncbi:FG-GAP repeat protein [Variovorax sp. ZS18.2.2]|nr:FG-GAP repeat protein [Variovorax sp. ZS18.2.2]
MHAGSSYSIGGTVSGLTGPLRLRLNGIDEFTVNGSGVFTAPIAVIANNPYEITLVAQSVGFTCAVNNGTGTAKGPVTTVKVTCSQLAYTLGGNITGLKGSVVLRSDGATDLTVSANGAFTFRDPFPHGGTYAVSVKTMPAAQTCVVSNGSGNVTANVSSIAVNCTDTVVPVPPPPSRPMEVVSYGVKAYNFSWGGVPHATYYKITQDVGGAPFKVVGDNITGTTFSLQNVVLMDTNSHLFTFRLQACNASGCSNPVASPVLVPVANNAIGYLKPSTGSVSNIQYGQSVALSKDGTWLVVAASSIWHAGFIEIYSRRSGQWAFETRLTASNAEVGDNFGSSLSISKDGSTVLVGASGESSSATKVGGDKADNTVLESGAAYVFERTGTTWAEVAYLKAATSTLSEKFGSATALSADGSIAWVAGNGNSVHGYRKVDGTWSHFNSASTSIPGEGRSLAVSDDGATLAVGMPLDSTPDAWHSGAVLVLKWTIPTLSKTYYLKESLPQPGNKLGAAVAISADGSSIAAGIPLKTVGPTDFAGAVTFFNLDGGGTSYAQDGYVYSPLPKNSAEFGRSVALSSDGSVLVAGGPVMSAGMQGINAELDYSGPNKTGVVIRFVKSQGAWRSTTAATGKILDYNDFLGQSISVSGDGKTVAAGAPGEDSRANGIGGDFKNNDAHDVGAVYLY